MKIELKTLGLWVLAVAVISCLAGCRVLTIGG